MSHPGHRWIFLESIHLTERNQLFQYIRTIFFFEFFEKVLEEMNYILAINYPQTN